ncbi:Alpha/beta hydrolase fold-1 [Mycena galopus ATCC 62051]|nr:Alpha/beta hydrolase fold-1 [Mycena galopus ATCC 62051]
MGSAVKPTFVLVPGVAHTTAHFQPILNALHARGYPTEVISHPTVGALAATAPLNADAVNFRRVLEELVKNQEKDVILFCHSYGGAIGSQNAGFERSARARAGQRGGIIKAIYLSAHLSQDGENIPQTLAELGIVLRWLDVNPTTSTFTANSLAAETLYHDLPDDQAGYWASKLEPMSSHAVIAVPCNTRWDTDVPKVYIFCKNDRTIELFAQQRLLERVLEGQNKDSWKTYEMDCGHCPFLSHVEELVEILTKA